MVEARRIADVLGGKSLGTIRSLSDLVAAVERGLPKTAVRSVLSHAARTPAERKRLRSQIIPEATYKRRRDRLTLAESERTERLARVIATAEFVWNDLDEARRFLNTRHPALRGQSPLEAARTELGAREVEGILAALLHGLPA
jgi:putative toxin-antitoxin system antitoxin component (TIGR02293 family)